MHHILNTRIISTLRVSSLLLLSFLGTLQAQDRVSFNGQQLFLNGVNLAWKQFADDIGPSSSTPDLNHFENVFDRVKANGGNCLRLWLHTNGAHTPAWNGSMVTGPGKDAISDLRAILDQAWERKVGLMLCLWSFDMQRIEYGTGITDRARAILTTPANRQSYIDNALIPMVQALKGHPAIQSWEIFNEPEGMSNEFGWDFTRHVPMSDIQAFVNQCAGAIKRTDPGAQVTNGSWSFFAATDVGEGNLNYYRDDRLIAAGGDRDGTLDFYCVHYYDWAGTVRSPFHHQASHWGLDKPLVVAEFYPGSDHGCQNCGSSPHQALFNLGYAGALGWSWTDRDPSTLLAQTKAMADAYPNAVRVDGNNGGNSNGGSNSGDGTGTAPQTSSANNTGSFYNAATYQWDFGSANSPLFSGYSRVTEATTQGYARWTNGSGLRSADRGGSQNALNRDFVYSKQAKTFSQQIANGTYEVALNLFDANYRHDNMQVRAEGQVKLSNQTFGAGSGNQTKTFNVTVSDGSLDLEFSDQGGNDVNWVLSRIVVARSSSSGGTSGGNNTSGGSSEARQFDFGTASSPLQAAAQRVSPNTTSGSYRWTGGAIQSRDRGNAGNASNLNRDFNFSNQARTFVVDGLANGNWQVEVTIGDASYAHGNAVVSTRGTTIFNGVSTNANQFKTQSSIQNVTDGKIEISFRSNGGNSPYWTVTQVKLSKQ